MHNKSRLSRFIEDRYLYLMLIPALIWVIVICYGPMYGLYMAFVDFKLDGRPFFTSLITSEFVGLKWFKYFFFQSGDAFKVIRNTLGTSVLTLILGFPIPIIIAIALNEVTRIRFKKVVQTVSYMPHFLSWVIVANMFILLLSSDGIVNKLIQLFNLTQENILFLQEERYFWWIIAIANTWKSMGYNAIIYLAAITAIDPALYEAAKVDGATKWKQILHITLPSLKPTIVVLLILSVGALMNAGFEQQFLLQNPLVRDYALVIDLYSYEYGLKQGMFSYATAVGLFKSLVSFVMLVSVNKISQKLNGYGLY